MLFIDPGYGGETVDASRRADASWVVCTVCLDHRLVGRPRDGPKV